MPALQESRRYNEVADLVQHFHPHSEELVRVLCDGRLYQKAVLEASTMSDSSHLSFVRSNLMDFAKQTIEKTRLDHEQFRTQVKRLQTIREEKSQKLMNGDADEDVDDCDMFSDTTSMNSSRFTGGSRGTARTFRSSKSKRKHERKLMSLKEGNPFEDIALIDALYTHIQNAYGQQQPINELLKSLVDLEVDEIAIDLQHVFGDSLDQMKQMMDVIWLPEMMVSGEIKVEDYMDYVKAQNDQHYAMISKLF